MTCVDCAPPAPPEVAPSAPVVRCTCCGVMPMIALIPSGVMVCPDCDVPGTTVVVVG